MAQEQWGGPGQAGQNCEQRKPGDHSQAGEVAGSGTKLRKEIACTVLVGAIWSKNRV